MGLKLRDNKLITGLDTLCSMTRASPIQNLLEFSVLGQVSLGLTFFFFFFILKFFNGKFNECQNQNFNLQTNDLGDILKNIEGK